MHARGGQIALRPAPYVVGHGSRKNPSTWTYIAATAAGVAVVGGAVYLGYRVRRRRPRPYPWPKPYDYGVRQAAGDPQPMWPVASNSRHHRRLEVAYRDRNGQLYGNPSRRFHTTRSGRYHVGVDLYANAGDVVLAPEDGTVVATQHFLNGTHAMLVQGKHDVTLLLGEVAPKSWREFGVDVGSVVKKGQPVARVGLTNNGSHMLHFEAYRCCPTKNQSWYRANPVPPNVLDPTDYLLRALAGEVQVA